MMPIDDDALMRIRADTIWTYNARGRMVRSNEPEGQPAPRLFVGRTRAGHVVRFADVVPRALARELAAIVERQPPVDALPIPPSLRAALRAVLDQDEPVGAERGGPAYRFPNLLVRPADVVEVTSANVEVVRETFPWLYHDLDSWSPGFVVVRDGAAVAACFSSRIGVEAQEAGVLTLPEFRGRGFAVTVTAAWAAAVQASGRIPLYSTAWENVASQGVARRLGLTMFGSDATWT